MPPSKGKGRDVGRSRNSTPVSAGSIDHAQTSPGLQLNASKMSYDDILDRYCRGSSPPASATLRKIADALRTCSDVAKTRSDTCDKGMRGLSKKRKALAELAREEEIAERLAQQESRERLNHDDASKEEDAENRPPAVGARSVARQDGMEIDGMLKISHVRPADTRKKTILQTIRIP